MKTITVLLADDHTIVREGLRALLATEPNIEVVGEAKNGHQAVAFASALMPDVIVMDLSMPLLNGLDAITRIRENTPASTKILILSSHDDEAYVQKAKELGASGYLVKQSDAQVLCHAINEVHAGRSYFRPIKSTTLQNP
jgi:DNA-binding NarL/FixJ family response regulator